MRRLLVLLVVLAVAGCSAAVPEPGPSRSQDVGYPVYPSRTPRPTPTPTPTPSPTPVPEPTPERDPRYYYEGSMRLVDCAAVNWSFTNWLAGLQQDAWINRIAVGAVVTSPTDEWAVVGVELQGQDGARDVVYVTQNPPSGPDGPADPELELIRGGSPDDGTYPAELETNTRWAGDLMVLGEQAAQAALACVG